MKSVKNIFKDKI